MTFPGFLSLLFWGSVMAGATALVVRRPDAAVRAAKGVLAALAFVWVLGCALGIAVQATRRGAGLMGLWHETPFDRPHTILSHVAVVLVVVAFCLCVPVAIEQAVRRGGVVRLLLHLALAFATEVLVLLTVFTGYLGRPPRTDGSILRFAVLHFVATPLMGTLTLLGWLLVVRRYGRDAHPRRFRGA